METNFKNLIGSYPDFPKKGILFRDLMPVLRDPKAFSSLIENMANLEICRTCDAILAIDARGFILGTGIALKLMKPLVVARKFGKLPGELITEKYFLEYGQDSLSVQKDASIGLERFTNVEDVLATGGTAECVSNLLIQNNKIVNGLAIAIELCELGGRKKFDFPVETQISF